MFDTPLRYPGGKGRLTQHVIDVMEMNDLVGGHYAEPYAGGAGIAITLLYLEYADHIHLNDLDLAVYSFWRSIIDNTEEFVRLVRDTPLTVEEWRKQRALQYAKAEAGTLELGFSTFYMNRTSRSGILRGGVIGGVEQTGKWKMDARYNRDELIRRIEKVASYSSRISLYNRDASVLISEVLPNLPARSLVYLDPPYYHHGSRLYHASYKHDDHARIAGQVKDIGQRWIVSYDNVEPIRELYADYRQQTFGLRWTAQRRYDGVEVMVYCDDLAMPDEVRPFRGMAA
ncbi:DNA adenine methylase [Sphingomonas flavalba]|uniref:DNA adenine methylase n=1 Tax=Sphingomonas flavalba TaxID=2559804 RepID=UPI00109E1DDC|nr:DNA adenine methylase [Sphingomonas flavalba]